MLSNDHQVHNNLFNSTSDVDNQYSSNLNFDNNFWSKPNGSGFSDNCNDSDTDGFCDIGYTADVIDNQPLSIFGLADLVNETEEPTNETEEPEICVSNWICNSHSSCQSNNIQVCSAVIDTNNCSEPFGGSLNDYSLSCTYNPPNNDGSSNSNNNKRSSSSKKDTPHNYIEHSYDMVFSSNGLEGIVDMDNISLKKYLINVTKNIYNVNIKISNLESLDSSMPPLSNVIKMFKIDHKNLDDSNIASATLEIEIDSKYDSYYIFLYRYHNEEWQEFNATKISQENSLSLYAAQVPGFSYFAITYGDSLPIELSTEEIELESNSLITGNVLKPVSNSLNISNVFTSVIIGLLIFMFFLIITSKK
jgi:PGF-pre-PGF domain-containing protein